MTQAQRNELLNDLANDVINNIRTYREALKIAEACGVYEVEK